jgi:acetoin utilization deacetylase AcuC-like enzyme
MRFWSHDRHGFPLPQGHRFPLPKYRLLREAVEREGLGEVCGSDAASWDLLATVHERAYLDRVRRGELTRREERALGLPWSPELVERGRRSTFGTVHAARDALARGVGMNLGGGTHHAAFAQGRGYCLFNDVVVAIAALRAEAGLGRVLVVDCDVHQGDGTAELLAGDPRSFTLSLHGGANYPFHRATSDLDVDLRTGTGDDEYLEALEDALATAVPTAHPDLVFFLAGADPWAGDRLGRLALTKAGLRARDALVLDTAERAGAPVCVVLAGGYAPDVADTVEINLATARAVARRSAGMTPDHAQATAPR